MRSGGARCGAVHKPCCVSVCNEKCVPSPTDPGKGSVLSLTSLQFSGFKCFWDNSEYLKS